MEQNKFYQIKNVTEHEYTLVGCDGSVIIRPIQDVDKSASVFNIQDAKDGDVLRIRNLTFIFQEITNNNVCHKDAVVAYCSYEDNDDGFGVCGPDCITDLEIITPATKEQRDTLMKAMADAGYTFDFEKKELKKIEQTSADETPYPETLEKAIDLYYYSYGNGKGEFEHLSLEKFRDIVLTFVSDYGQKPAWSEEDEEHINSLLKRLEGICKPGAAFISTRFTISEDKDWLKSLKGRVQPKQEWSEEAQQIIKDAACFILSCVNAAETKEEEERLEELADKLQDLRPQSQWKPSDEQIMVLAKASETYCDRDKSTLYSLYNDLKKLRDE